MRGGEREEGAGERREKEKWSVRDVTDIDSRLNIYKYFLQIYNHELSDFTISKNNRHPTDKDRQRDTDRQTDRQTESL